MLPRPRKIGALVAFAGALAVLGFTLYPSAPGPAAASTRTPLTCIVCGENGGVDVILNLILFLPLGVGLGLAGWSWRRAAAVAALLSFSVEAMQYFVIPGRDPSLGDLLNNSVSGALGAKLGDRLPLLWRPDRRTAGRLLLAGSGLWLGVLAVSAWALSPGMNRGELLSTWGHPARKPYQLTGEVRSVTLGGVPVPKDGALRTAALRQQLEQGEVEVAASVLSGRPPRHVSWIYSITVDGKPQLLLTQKGRRAAITVPALALRLKLQPPTLRLGGGYPLTAGVPVAVTGGRSRNRIWLASSYGGRRRTAELALSPSHGWVLIAPFGFPLGPGLRLITATWLALLLLPLGYWGAHTHRALAAAALLGGALAVGLGGLPAVAGLAPVHWSEWLAAGMATAGGWALRRPAAYLQLRCGSPSTSESFSS